jgi:hypothetical protein
MFSPKKYCSLLMISLVLCDFVLAGTPVSLAPPHISEHMQPLLKDLAIIKNHQRFAIMVFFSSYNLYLRLKEKIQQLRQEFDAERSIAETTEYLYKLIRRDLSIPEASESKLLSRQLAELLEPGNANNCNAEFIEFIAAMESSYQGYFHSAIQELRSALMGRKGVCAVKSVDNLAGGSPAWVKVSHQPNTEFHV